MTTVNLEDRLAKTFMNILGWEDVCYKGCSNPFIHSHSVNIESIKCPRCNAELKECNESALGKFLTDYNYKVVYRFYCENYADTAFIAKELRLDFF
jgi:hypothetical protein